MKFSVVRFSFHVVKRTADVRNVRKEKRFIGTYSLFSIKPITINSTSLLSHNNMLYIMYIIYIFVNTYISLGSRIYYIYIYSVCVKEVKYDDRIVASDTLR